MKKLLITLLCVGSLKAIHTSDLYTVKNHAAKFPKELNCICLGHKIWVPNPVEHNQKLRLSQLRDLNLMRNQPTKIRQITIDPQALHTVIATTPLAQTQTSMQFASEVDKSRKIDNRPTKQNINNQ